MEREAWDWLLLLQAVLPALLAGLGSVPLYVTAWTNKLRNEVLNDKTELEIIELEQKLFK